MKNVVFTVEDIDRVNSRNKEALAKMGLSYLVKKKKFNYQKSDSENDDEDGSNNIESPLSPWLK